MSGLRTDGSDGGQAFPISSDVIGDYPGMSLRDWFAGQATDEDIRSYREALPSSGIHARYRFTRVQARWRFADAMLEARE